MTETKPDTLLTALLAAQKKASALNLVPDGTNPAFKSKYVKLDKLLNEALPILNAQGLVWTTFPTTLDGEPALHYSLVHAATGEAMNGTMPLLLDKQNSQGFGSAITYARRQSLMAVLGLAAGEDDDGNKASTGEVTREVRKKDGNRLLNDEEKAVVVDAIQKAVAEKRITSPSVDMLYRSVGCDDLDSLTVFQGREIMRKIGVPTEASAK